MEYHCGNKDVQVASRIFEKGMETFGEEVDFVLRYLGFLISINDENSEYLATDLVTPLTKLRNADGRALFERVIGSFTAEQARPLWDRWARYEYQYGDLAAAHKLEKRMAEVYPSGMLPLYLLPANSLTPSVDPPIKRFAERHKYLNIDAIAVRDLGFVLGRQNSRANGSGNLGRSETLQSLGTPQSKETQPIAPSSSKRAVSPDHRRRDESRSEYPSKRLRPTSPVRERDRDWREGREGPRGRRHNSPGWERDRERDAPPRRSFIKEEKEEDKGVVIPNVLSWFIGTLPTANSFDGEHPTTCFNV